MCQKYKMKYLIHRHTIFVLKSLSSKLLSTEFKSSIVSTTEKLNSLPGSCEWASVLWLFCSRSLISVSKKMVFLWNSVLKKNPSISFWSHLPAEVINNNYNTKYDKFCHEIQLPINILVNKEYILWVTYFLL